MMLSLAIVATLVTYVSTCCQPQQYEAHVGFVLGTFNKTTKVGNYMEVRPLRSFSISAIFVL